MKFTVLGFMAALVVSASAQNATSAAVTSQSAVFVPASTTVATQPAPTSSSSCSVQSTFELCLSNEENYIKTCQELDYACLCRWNKEKLTCYNNCPNDAGYASQYSATQSYCSMPGANVSIAPWTSTVAATSSIMAATSVMATSTSATTATPSNSHSGASVLAIGQSAFAAVGAIAAYMLF